MVLGEGNDASCISGSLLVVPTDQLRTSKRNVYSPCEVCTVNITQIFLVNITNIYYEGLYPFTANTVLCSY